MKLVIKLSQKLSIGFYKAIEKGSKRFLFYGSTKRECIAQGKAFARRKKKTLLRIINSEGKEIYKSKLFYRENLKS